MLIVIRVVVWRKMAPEVNDIMPKVAALLNHFGSICSIVGFILTIFILWNLRHVRRHFLFQARFPNLKKKISEHRKSLSQLLNTHDTSKEQIQIELQKCRANLNSLKPKLNRSLANVVKQIIKQIKRTCRSYSQLSESQVREIHINLVFLEQELENLKQDIKWETKK